MNPGKNRPAPNSNQTLGRQEPRDPDDVDADGPQPEENRVSRTQQGNQPGTKRNGGKDQNKEA
jgi:hypothetical protein